MLFRIWFSSSLCYWLLIPFSWIYGLIIFCRRFIYQYGWIKIYRFSVPVIVIGNLTVGGNGKTPVVLWLIEQLQSRGWTVGVVSRGYKGKSNKYPIILKDTSCIYECGDEPMLIWKRTGVAVAVSPKRSEAVAALLKNKKTLDIIISDDGLQHYALSRDIEWVIISSILRFGNGYWLPAGPMRERISRLKTVQAIIVNGSYNHTVSSEEIPMQLYPAAVINVLTGERKSITSLTRVVAMAGIGYPSQFFTTLVQYGLNPIKTISFSDHQKYSENMLLSLTKKEEVLLMTEKDAIKCINFAHKHWWYVYAKVKIDYSNAKKLLNNVENVIQHYKKLNCINS